MSEQINETKEKIINFLENFSFPSFEGGYNISVLLEGLRWKTKRELIKNYHIAMVMFERALDLHCQLLRLKGFLNPDNPYRVTIFKTAKHNQVIGETSLSITESLQDLFDKREFYLYRTKQLMNKLPFHTYFFEEIIDTEKRIKERLLGIQDIDHRIMKDELKKYRDVRDRKTPEAKKNLMEILHKFYKYKQLSERDKKTYNYYTSKEYIWKVYDPNTNSWEEYSNINPIKPKYAFMDFSDLNIAVGNAKEEYKTSLNNEDFYWSYFEVRMPWLPYLSDEIMSPPKRKTIESIEENIKSQYPQLPMRDLDEEEKWRINHLLEHNRQQKIEAEADQFLDNKCTEDYKEITTGDPIPCEYNLYKKKTANQNQYNLVRKIEYPEEISNVVTKIIDYDSFYEYREVFHRLEDLRSQLNTEESRLEHNKWELRQLQKSATELEEEIVEIQTRLDTKYDLLRDFPDDDSLQESIARDESLMAEKKGELQDIKLQIQNKKAEIEEREIVISMLKKKIAAEEETLKSLQ